MEKNEHMDALMEQWANNEVGDLELLDLLVNALAELKSYLLEVEWPDTNAK